VSYRAIISYRLVPTRRYRKYYDHSVGRWKREYYIVHRRKPIWGHKSKTITKIVKTPTSPKIALKPNNLTYSSYTVSNRSPLDVRAEVTDGPYKGEVSEAKGLGMQSFRFNAIFGSSMGSNPDLSSPIISPTLVSEMNREALSAVYVRAADGYANVANMLAQADKTISMGSSILGSFLSLYRSLRKLDSQRAKLAALGLRKEARTAARHASELWLSYVYGVSPLISDISKIAGEVSSQDSWRTYSARAVRTLPRTVNTNLQAAKTEMSENVSIVVKYQVTMSCAIDIPSFSVRHGFLTPAATVWEVIPFSFIFDWIYPLGNYLQAHKVFNYNVMWAHRSQLVKYSRSYGRTFGFVEKGTSSPFIIGGKPQYASINGVTFDRSILTSIPAMPYPKINRSGLTARRALNALALLMARK
jgi:hypothetical protein